MPGDPGELLPARCGSSPCRGGTLRLPRAARGALAGAGGAWLLLPAARTRCARPGAMVIRVVGEKERAPAARRAAARRAAGEKERAPAARRAAARGKFLAAVERMVVGAGL